MFGARWRICLVLGLCLGCAPAEQPRVGGESPDKHAASTSPTMGAESQDAAASDGAAQKTPVEPTKKPAAANADEELSAEAIVRRATDFLKAQPRYQLSFHSTFHAEFGDQVTNVATRYEIRVERPHRVAVVLDDAGERVSLGNLAGGTLVCDGRREYELLANQNRYTVRDAPAEPQPGAHQELFAQNGPFIEAVIAADPYPALMDRVRQSSYLGDEQVGQRRCRHCRFTQDDLAWDGWFNFGEPPTIVKISPDFSKRYPADGQMKFGLEILYDDWNFDPRFDADAFAFVPPPGAEKVDSLAPALPTSEPHALVGLPAPAFQTKLLGGEAVDFRPAEAKQVVILDFWASWCGPCVKALPEITKLAEKYRARGVAFYAVNCGEQPEDIAKFLKEAKLDAPIALDPDSEITKLYQAEAIPQTVLVGKDGLVQVVHVGAPGDLDATLGRELERLLAGENLAAEVAERRDAKASKIAPEHLKLAWSAEGPWVGVAADAGQQLVYASGHERQCVKFSAAGERLAKLDAERVGLTLRAANLTGDKRRELLSFTIWGEELAAHDPDGKLLWTFPREQGINDVWPADLDDDGVDETIVGYNGFSGLQVVTAEGQLKWKNPRIGNIWHVCAGDLTGDGKPEVLCTSAKGKLHVMAGDGAPLKDLDMPCYAHMIRVTRSSEAGRPQQAIVGGESWEGGHLLVSIVVEQGERWRLRLPVEKGVQINAAECAAGRPWMALAMSDGFVYVVDTDHGKPLARIGGQAAQADVAWLERGSEAPLLLATSGKLLQAFEVETSPSPDANEPAGKAKPSENQK